MRYVNVVTKTTAKALDRLFTYSVPDTMADKITVGSIVEVPFGKSNKSQQAFVVECENISPMEGIEIKSVLSVKEEHFLTPAQIELALWMKQYYSATLSSVLKLMLPPSLQVRQKKQIYYYLKVTQEELDTYKNSLHAAKNKKRLDLLDYIKIKYKYELSDLSDKQFFSKNILDALVREGIIGKEEKSLSVLEPYKKGLSVRESEISLNQKQRQIFEEICADFQGIHLIHGITGSGKTEIYFHLIDKVLAEGKQAIMLFPEIGLTFALIRRFLERYGDAVGLFHSRMSEGEKLTEWERARNGESRIMIGPRSALFAPFDHLGLILIDEEHESSYKSDFMPKFQTMEVAAKLAKIKKIPVVLGSATPSVESYYYGLQQRFRLHHLNEKALSKQPIEVQIVDMRKELEEGNRSFLSHRLEVAIREALSRNEQIILLNNRRGFAKFVSCRKCGFVYKCPHCELPMTYHRNPEQVKCHYCGFSDTMKKSCPSCQSKYLKAFGMGTQKIEMELQKLFPKTPIIRMDYDTTRNKHGHDLLLQKFEKAESGILVGTQMIAKGLDFHNVTVVGVLAVDQGLYSDDFRAAERTFQLLTQVIGRTGRGEKLGRAFLQTYSPEHFAVLAGVSQDYLQFYQEEIVYRRLLNNPPFSELLQIVLAHTDKNLLDKMSSQIVNELKQLQEKRGLELEILGPVAPYLFKHSDYYRKSILLKANRHKELTFIMNYLYNKEIDKNGFHLNLDINPQFLY